MEIKTVKIAETLIAALPKKRTRFIPATVGNGLDLQYKPRKNNSWKTILNIKNEHKFSYLRAVDSETLNIIQNETKNNILSVIFGNEITDELIERYIAALKTAHKFF